MLLSSLQIVVHKVLVMDSSIGRIDKASLSQQTLMELLMEDLTNTEQICGSKENLRDLHDWKNVIFDINSNITAINWGFTDLSGSVNLDWVPPTVEMLRLAGNKLAGTLGLENLPACLKELHLSVNQFLGKVSLRSLPKSLETMHLSGNRLSGSLCLTNLPSSLKVLHVNTNLFTGEVDLTKLPYGIEVLSLADNKLSGLVDLTQLPSTLKNLFLNENDFCGETDFSHLPQLTYFNVSNTKLSGTVVGFSGFYIGVDNSDVRKVRH